MIHSSITYSQNVADDRVSRERSNIVINHFGINTEFIRWWWAVRLHRFLNITIVYSIRPDNSKTNEYALVIVDYNSQRRWFYEFNESFVNSCCKNSVSGHPERFGIVHFHHKLLQVPLPKISSLTNFRSKWLSFNNLSISRIICITNWSCLE